MSFTGDLRPYQEPVVDAMVERGLFLLTAGVGVGKTPMTIAAVERLAEEFGDEFSCVVQCAGGLKQQWANQIAEFTCRVCRGDSVLDPTHPEHDAGHQHDGSSACIVVDGPPDKRFGLYDRVHAERPRYVIIGNDQVVDDWSEVSRLKPMCIVIDEITSIKTPTAKLTNAVHDTFGEVPFRFGLTGTPMENGRPEELFQVMTFIDDSVLGREDLFDATFVRRNKYGGVEEYVNLPLFYELMRDCSTSIDADDPEVSPYMPKMARPRRVLVQLDAETARVYELMSADLRKELAEAAKKSKGGVFDVAAHYAGTADESSAKGRVMSRISCMRMLCAHPDVLRGSAEEFLDNVAAKERIDAAHKHHVAALGKHAVADCPLEQAWLAHRASAGPKHRVADGCCPPRCPQPWPKLKKQHGKKTVMVDRPFDGSAYAASLLLAGHLDELDETPKMDELEWDSADVLAGKCDCCSAGRTDGQDPALVNKLVIFSYHKGALKILQRRFPELSVRYDGDMSLKQRNEFKRQFQQDPKTRLFLTSDAGGYGVDLPQANHLFNVDKPFTAGRVTQRNARVRRANLNHHDEVHVRDYLIYNSLEVYYAALTEGKQAVAAAVRTGQGTVKGGIVVNGNSLGRFLAENHV